MKAYLSLIHFKERKQILYIYNMYNVYRVIDDRVYWHCHDRRREANDQPAEMKDWTIETIK